MEFPVLQAFIHEAANLQDLFHDIIFMAELPETCTSSKHHLRVDLFFWVTVKHNVEVVEEDTACITQFQVHICQTSHSIKDLKDKIKT